MKTEIIKLSWGTHYNENVDANGCCNSEHVKDLYSNEGLHKDFEQLRNESDTGFIVRPKQL